MEYFSDLKAKLIYVFRIPDEAHRDCVKIGEATFDDGDISLQPNRSQLNKAAKARMFYNILQKEAAPILTQPLLHLDYNKHSASNNPIDAADPVPPNLWALQ